MGVRSRVDRVDRIAAAISRVSRRAAARLLPMMRSILRPLGLRLLLVQTCPVVRDEAHLLHPLLLCRQPLVHPILPLLWRLLRSIVPIIVRIRNADRRHCVRVRRRAIRHALPVQLAESGPRCVRSQADGAPLRAGSRAAGAGRPHAIVPVSAETTTERSVRKCFLWRGGRAVLPLKRAASHHRLLVLGLSCLDARADRLRWRLMLLLLRGVMCGGPERSPQCGRLSQGGSLHRLLVRSPARRHDRGVRAPGDGQLAHRAKVPLVVVGVLGKVRRGLVVAALVLVAAVSTPALEAVDELSEVRSLFRRADEPVLQQLLRRRSL